jgi:tRNA modification GTPase TrmE
LRFPPTSKFVEKRLMSELLANTGTIAAIATAVVPQQGSVGIVRVSGDLAMAIAHSLFYAPGRQVWSSHRIIYGYIRQPQTQQIVDEALLLIMKAPRSFTREDVVEFHCHGGIMAVQQVLQLCLENGARLAQPGEFTLRAFLNGRLDLTQAESIADLVGAKSPQAAQTALAGLQGKLAQPIRKLRANCLDILAEIEARIDFEEDLPPLDQKRIITEIEQVTGEINKLLATKDQGELLRTGLKVAIVGRPNVGKSSLLNALAGENRSIVDDVAGTTRDPVDELIEFGGSIWRFIDTAGLRKRANQASGTDYYATLRTQAALERCECAVVVLDASEPISEQDLRVITMVEEAGKAMVIVMNKWDLVDEDRRDQLDREIDRHLDQVEWAQRVNVAAKTGWHRDRLAPALRTAIDSWERRVPTAKLNSFLGALIGATPPPVRGGKQPKIYYATQAGIAPPKFVIFSSGWIEASYRRFIERRLREEFGFPGTPVQVAIRVKERD